jgi:hypothetical protein
MAGLLMSLAAVESRQQALAALQLPSRRIALVALQLQAELHHLFTESALKDYCW